MKHSNVLALGLMASAKMPDDTPKSTWKDHRFDMEKGYTYWLDAAPIRFYPGHPLPDSINKTDKAYVLDCAIMMESGSNMLIYRSDRTYKPMSIEMLAKRLDRSASIVYRFVRRMCKLRIMAREDGRIYINPVYFFRGKHLSYHLYALFRPELQAVLPKWVVAKYEGTGEA